MKLVLFIAVLVGLSASSHAEEMMHFATCNFQDAVESVTPLQTYKIYVRDNPISPTEASVEMRGLSPMETEPTRVSAQFGFHTWTTFMARFAAEGDETTIEFAQAVNPSFGVLKDSRGTRQVACYFSYKGLTE